MEQTELDKLMEELRLALQGCGIPVSNKIAPAVGVNTRAKRRLGCCYCRAGSYAVEVAERILDDPALLRETLAHELLHTCPGCRNHGTKWKAWAEKANEALGVHIQRTVPVEDGAGPLRHEEVKYVLECQSCGARIERMRLSKAVKAPWRYRCRCGGKLKRIR